jgi:hypothetical protein
VTSRIVTSRGAESDLQRYRKLPPEVLKVTSRGTVSDLQRY